MQTTYREPQPDAAPATASLTPRAITIDEWQQFVDSRPDRSIFHHRAWIELLTRQYGLRCHFPALLAGGEIVAAAPFMRTRSMTGRTRYVSLPFTDSVHALVCSPELRGVFLKALQFDPTLQSVRGALMRTSQPLSNNPPASHAVKHLLDLSRPLCEIQSAFHKSVQRNLRRAEKHDLRFDVSTDPASLESFYRLHVATRRKLGVPVQPRNFFRLLHEQIIARGLGVVGIVSHRGAPVAAGVYLNYNRVLMAKYLASDPAALEHRPNEWLMFNMIRWAHEHDYTSVNLGLCDRQQEGLRRFKQKWGTVERDLFVEYVIGRDEAPGKNSRLLEAAGVVIRNSPPFVCRALGEMFYRYSY